MIFENAGALWLLPALPFLLFALGLWGWMAKKEIAATFLLAPRRLRKKQVEKYILAGVLMTLLIMALALPKVAFSSFVAPGRTGDIALLVDVSESMAAQKDINSPSQLDKVKPMLYEIIDHMEESEQVNISLDGFTNIARSLVPFVGKEDYPYLRVSIDKVLNINSVPGSGTSLGGGVLGVVDKFPKGGQAKLIIMFSDGQPFLGLASGMSAYESGQIEQAIAKAQADGIKVITVGVGEPAGAKVPLRNALGAFTGDYAQLQESDYISYLEEDGLKELASGTGGEYFSEDNQEGLVEFISQNLGSVTAGAVTTSVKNYQSVALWFLLASLPVWVVFVRRHLLS